MAGSSRSRCVVADRVGGAVDVVVATATSSDLPCSAVRLSFVFVALLRSAAPLEAAVGSLADPLLCGDSEALVGLSLREQHRAGEDRHERGYAQRAERAVRQRLMKDCRTGDDRYRVGQ
jgi:hypothetical protein